MPNFMKYATAAALGYAMRAYSQRQGHAKPEAPSPLPGIVTGYVVEWALNKIWPQKQPPQIYRKVPFTNHYVPEEKSSGFHNLYKNFRRNF